MSIIQPPPVEPISRVVSLNELETILRRTGWKEWVIDALLNQPPLPKSVHVGGTEYIIRSF